MNIALDTLKSFCTDKAMYWWNLFYFIARVILLILWVGFFLLCCLIMPIKTLPFPIFARGALYLIGFNLAPHQGVADPDARILISNHPGCQVDGLVWVSGLPHHIGFVARADAVPPAHIVVKAFNNHRKCVLVSRTEKENTVERMKQFLKDHPDKKIMLAAEGGDASMCGLVPKEVLFKFRTGGFRVTDRVQPMLVRSTTPIPDMPRLISEFIPYMWRHRDEPPATLYIEYLPAVDREEDESPEDFSVRVRDIMQAAADDKF